MVIKERQQLYAQIWEFVTQNQQYFNEVMEYLKMLHDQDEKMMQLEYQEEQNEKSRTMAAITYR